VAVEPNEAKVIVHFIDKGCYTERESFLESTNKIKEARFPLILGRVFLALP
jgi:hypothetical protein